MAKIPEHHMVTCLKMLRPGQRLIYYTGDFEADIARCRPSKREQGGAPTYAAQLHAIHETAAALEREGRVKLSKSTRAVGRGPRNKKQVTEYIATGI